MFEKTPELKRFTFPGKVWKVIPDEAMNLILVESRESELGKCWISIMELEGGEVKVFHTDDHPGGFAGLLDTYGGFTIFFEVDYGNLPQMTSLYVYGWDPEKKHFGRGWGDTNWSYLGLTEVGMWGTDEGIPFVSTGSDELELLSPASGELIRKVAAEERQRIIGEIERFGEARMVERAFPRRILASEEAFENFAKEIEHRASVRPVGQLEYLWKGEWLARVFYTPEKNGLRRHFQLLHGPVLKMDLDLGRVEKMMMESFFWFRGRLVLLGQDEEMSILA